MTALACVRGQREASSSALMGPLKLAGSPAEVGLALLSCSTSDASKKASSPDWPKRKLVDPGFVLFEDFIALEQKSSANVHTIC